MQQARRIVRALQQNIGKVIVGKEEVVRLALITMLCGGHVLIEDVPGVGKTMLCSALAKSLACSFKRIQFTPDVTPSDVTGFSIANFKTGELEFRPGAVMTQIVLADEINRTSPKTQSSLLEVMEEKQVTVDGVTYQMPQPFMVLATQNPVEFVGTYPLPEAQMDRFFMRISIGYPSVEDEMDILERYASPVTPLSTLTPVCNAEDVLMLQEAVQQVYCSKEVRSYIATLCAATRKHSALQLGASTRAAIALVRASQACALLDGRDFILPEDVQSMSQPVVAHRILLSPESRMKGLTTARVLRSVLEGVPVPVKLP
jgi:MoxR-like ATPase